MNVTPDGDYQTYKAESGAYVRENFFGRDPRALELVEDLTDDQLWSLKRGGHDYRKVYAAFKAATEHKGQPTVILAKTIKGYGLGPSFEGRNATHQMKKMTLDNLKQFRDVMRIPITDAQLEENPYLPPFYHPGDDDEAIQYLQERRRALGGYLPERRSKHTRSRCPTTPRTRSRRRAPASRRSPRPWRSFGCSRTCCARRTSATASCRSSRMRRARSAWTRTSRRRRSTTRTASTTRRSTASCCSPTRRARRARSCTSASTRPARSRRSPTSGTSYSTQGEPLIPVYVFYSMFGFQRTGDAMWAAGDQMARGFIIGATAGRTTLTGEGLQHADGHSHLLAVDEPGRRVLRPGLRIRDRAHRARGPRAHVRRTTTPTRTSCTTSRSTTSRSSSPAEPEGLDVDGVVRGIYQLSESPRRRAEGPAARVGRRRAVGARGAGAARERLGRVGRCLERHRAGPSCAATASPPTSTTS